MTTHHIEDAERLCDRVAFIVGGRIVAAGTVAELMQNVGNEHIVRLAMSGSVKAMESSFQQAFSDFRIAAGLDNTCMVAAKGSIALLPVLKYLDGLGIIVYEAKEMHITLEEVFVKVTGIEHGRLGQENEGSKP